MRSEVLEYLCDSECTDGGNRLFAEFSIDALVRKFVSEDVQSGCLGSDFAFYGSGWQSWGFGGEIDAGKQQKKYFPIVPQWKNYFTVPGKRAVKGKTLVGSFIVYLRWNVGGKSVYLALCSTGNVRKSPESQALPPVRFDVDRKKRKIFCSAVSDGNKWNKNEKIAELCVFSANGFFELKDKIRSLYASDMDARFARLGFLGKRRIGGWESWYNHYADIDWNLIRRDLDAIGESQNIVKTLYIDKNKPCVFQVDDGWEISLGDWDARKDRFPQGMTALASEISKRGYIPGLWLAPLIVDLRSDFARKHKDWILRDKKGKPVAAGFNPLWGAKFGSEQPSYPHSYFCLDLSIDAVVEYLDSLMEKVVNEWGFRYLKLDFLFAGLLNGNFTNGGSAFRWYDRAIRTLTKRNVNKKGEGVAYLGCGLPFESSFNDFPLSRIGTDTKEDWDIPWMKNANYPARPSAFVNMQDTLGHAFWDMSVFVNDPDVVFMRSENISLSEKEKILIALVNFLFANQIMHSDDPSSFDSAKEGRLTETVAALYDCFEDAEFGVENVTSETYIIFSRDKKYVGFINLSSKKSFAEKSALEAYSCGGNFEPIVEFAKSSGNGFLFEPHSISIYECRAN